MKAVLLDWDTMGPALDIAEMQALLGFINAPPLAKDMDRLVNDLVMLPPFPEPVPASGSLWKYPPSSQKR